MKRIVYRMHRSTRLKGLWALFQVTQMPDLPRYPWNFNLINYMEETFNSEFLFLILLILIQAWSDKAFKAILEIEFTVPVSTFKYFK